MSPTCRRGLDRRPSVGRSYLRRETAGAGGTRRSWKRRASHVASAASASRIARAPRTISGSGIEVASWTPTTLLSPPLPLELALPPEPPPLPPFDEPPP